MSIYLRKRSPGVAPGVEWTVPGDVQEITDEDMARELAAHPSGEFTVVDPPLAPPAEAKAARARREVTETPPATKGGTGVTVPVTTTSKK
jgi:hypothetical protein